MIDNSSLLGALFGVAIALFLLLIWMFRYETVLGGRQHVNRITGAMCYVAEECWAP